MPKHRILIGFPYEAVVRKVDAHGGRAVYVAHLSGLDIAETFSAYSNNEELCVVDASSFSDKDFGAFLKVLERDVGGEVWFWNRELSMYPRTIQSRCAIDNFIGDTIGEVRTYLRKVGESHLLSDVLHLIHYGIYSAHLMAKRKEEFIDWLIRLDTTSNLEGFLPAIETFDCYHYGLLMEWIHRNDMFKEDHLKLCPFLLSMGFMDRVISLLSVGEDYRYENVFLYAFLMKVMSKRL